MQEACRIVFGENSFNDPFSKPLPCATPSSFLILGIAQPRL